MGKKLKDRTLIFPNYVRNYDQILYRNYFTMMVLFTISVANRHHQLLPLSTM